MSLLSIPMEKATERKTLKLSSSTPNEQYGNMGLELAALIGKSLLSELGASSRCQTQGPKVIHQNHPCQIAVNSKLGEDVLDDENKTSFD